VPACRLSSDTVRHLRILMESLRKGKVGLREKGKDSVQRDKPVEGSEGKAPRV